MTDNASPSNSNKKSNLKKGIDENVSRKLREDRSVQIRKDKRLDRTNLQRRRFQEDDEDEETKKKNKFKGLRRNLDAVPEKARQLHGEDMDELLDSVTYFRKVLAIDKCPPVDVIVEAGVVPRLVQLLGRSDVPKIQLEAAWAITNIACAEVHHAKLLIQCGAIPLLIHLIADTKDEAVREQALWALGNISADVNDCRDLLLQGGIIQPLLWQLGIGECPPHRRNASPSLSTMRHMTWLCSNLTRGYPPPGAEVCQPIIYALSELLQSPDEELLNDACTAISNICEISADNIRRVMEQGLLTRVRDLCDLPSNNCRETAVSTLCLVIRSPDTLQAKLLLSSRYKGVLRCIVEGVGNAKADKLKVEIYQTLRMIFEMDHKYIAWSLSLNLVDLIAKSLEKNAFEVNLYAGYCLCYVFCECAPDQFLQIIPQALPVLHELLSSTEPALLVSVLVATERFVMWVYSLSTDAHAAVGLLLTHMGVSVASMLYSGSDLRERVSLLSNHPFADIAKHATRLEDMMEKFESA